MKLLALICATLAGPVSANQISCDLGGTPVTFTIDRSQFAPAQNAGEPAQRRITTVRMGSTNFPAEPFIIGETRGFWAEGLGGTEAMLVVKADGSAVYANPRAGERLTGSCEVAR